jgi:hypothetical protein
VKPLDKLYGKGTSRAFSKVCGDDCKITQAETEKGVRAYFEWDDGSSMKVDFSTDAAYFVSLTSKRSGLYTHIVDTFPPLTRERGVKRWYATPAHDEAEAILLKRGKWRRNRDKSRLEWDF